MLMDANVTNDELENAKGQQHLGWTRAPELDPLQTPRFRTSASPSELNRGPCSYVPLLTHPRTVRRTPSHLPQT